MSTEFVTVTSNQKIYSFKLKAVIKKSVKLTDFGLAKFQSPDAKSSVMHTKLGTQNYMAPEFWIIKRDGTIEYHKSVDIYALGLTFLAMLNCTEGQKLKPVAEGRNQSEVGHAIGLIMYTRHTYGRPELDVVQFDQKDFNDYQLSKTSSEALKIIIRKATLFQPEKRPSARYLLAQLEDVKVTLALESTVASQADGVYII